MGWWVNKKGREGKREVLLKEEVYLKKMAERKIEDRKKVA